MNSPRIRILLVDDSPLALKILSNVLSQDPTIEIVGQAQNGVEALQLISQAKPTIICTDYFMPNMDGLELTKQIMHKCPMPILVVSSILNIRESKEVFSVLEAGALDCIQKPTAFDDEATKKAFIEKIRILSKVFVLQKINQISPTSYPRPKINQQYKVIIIGSSLGGPGVLSTILKLLPPHFSIPIICIQHMSKGFLEGFVEWVKSQCLLKVEIIKEEGMKQGYVYVPQEGLHLVMDQNMILRSSNAPPRSGHRPSVNVTMESVAQGYGKEAIGILLSGMGEDGAEGLKAIKDSGGLTIVQDEKSCPVFGMPKAAIEKGGASFIMNPIEIGQFLKSLNSNN